MVDARQVLHGVAVASIRFQFPTGEITGAWRKAPTFRGTVTREKARHFV